MPNKPLVTSQGQLLTPTSIETVSGRFVDLVNPDPSTIHINDIAWAISRMPRYVGHTISEVPYSIGQHSIFVMELVERLFHGDTNPGLRQSFYDFIHARYGANMVEQVHSTLKNPPHVTLLLECLLHDASEAYIVDVPTPLKQADGFKQVYAHLEHQMMNAIRKVLSMNELSQVHEVFVKWADQVALTIEAYHLVHSRGSTWTRLLPLGMTEMGLFEAPKAPIVVYDDFLACFGELTQHP